MTLRKKAGIYFAAGFTSLWIISNVALFIEFRSTLWDNFDSQLKYRAELIASRTNIDPIIVPIPDDGEIFVILFKDAYETLDTLFIPSPALYDQLLTQRSVRVIEEDEEEGEIIVIYAMSSSEVEKSLRKIIWILAVALIFVILLAFLAGYWLSGKLIRPLGKIIELADVTDLHNNTVLLNNPGSETEEELKQLTSSFNRMLSRIKEQSDLQITFFASASHELRTPLSIMQTRLQVLLAENQLSSDAKKIFHKQLAEVRRMIRMVNDFLLMSEIQNGSIKIIKTECDVSDIITTIIAQNKAMKSERGLNFKISFTPENESFSVWADEEKLRVILNNLIINALKYSQKNATIDILLQKANTGQTTVRISNEIREGVNPDVSAVKKSFYHSKPMHAEGSGLGLWIANRLSEMNGFKLSVSISGNIFEISLCM